MGYHCAGIFTYNEDLYKKLKNLAETTSSCEARELPRFDYIKKALKSENADIKNAGMKCGANASTAGHFLMEFIDCPEKFVHIDIAGLISEKDKIAYKYHDFLLKALYDFIHLT